MGALLSSSDSRARVIDAVDASGRKAEARAAGTELNEHVWYDLPGVGRIADAIASALGDIDPGHADAYRANAAQFRQQVQQLTAQVETARATTTGAGVATTEPVPDYLLDALGADDRTPEKFSAAVEEGDDVPPTAMRETLALFSGGRVRALVYNAQTTGPETDRVLRAAKDAGVAVVPVTETLPAGHHYVPWMRSTIAAVVAALSA
jgi:zinc/manganese transport system substrate-binding protein